MLSRAVRIGCAAGLTALALAACGDDDADATDEATSDDPFAAYTACLEDEGIDLPDDWSPFGEGGGFPGGGEMPTDMPTGGEMPTDMPTGEMPTDMPTGDMPSGGPGGGGGGFGGFEAPDGVDEDDWTAATEACAEELPQGGGGSGFPGGGQESAADETT
jgi:hypothetical protein